MRHLGFLRLNSIDEVSHMVDRGMPTGMRMKEWSFPLQINL